MLFGAFIASAFVVTAADEAGFKSIFNGTDLTGWQGNPVLWSVKDGAITGQTGAEPENKISHNTFLVYTNGNVDDFELRFSYKITDRGNSGVQYRSKVVEQGKFGPIVAGYQADFEGGKTYSGILYEERGRNILAQRGQKTTINAETGKPAVTGSVGNSQEIQAKIKPNDWNDYVVVAKGNHLQHFINGLQTIDVIDEQESKAAKSGVLALQIHAGPPMTVQFKNVRIKKLGKDSASGLLQQMAGNWVPVEATFNGEPVDRDRIENILMTIEGSKYTTKQGENVREGTLALDETKSPPALDVTRVRSSGETQTMPAICELKGDTLRICYGWETTRRPSEFKSEADSGTLLVSYKRE